MLWERRIKVDDVVQVAGTSILGKDGEDVVALAPETGAERWRAGGVLKVYLAVALAVGDSALLFQPGLAGAKATLSARDGLTGQERWSVPTDCGSLRLPIACGARIAAVCSKDNQTLIALDATTGEELWATRAPNNTGAMACDDEVLHITTVGPDGGLASYSLSTGEARGARYVTGYYNAPIRSGDKLLLLDDLAVWGYTAPDQEIVWLHSRDQRVLWFDMSYGLREGQFLLPRPDSIESIDIQTGKVSRRWTFPGLTYESNQMAATPFISASQNRLLATWVREDGSPYLLIWEGDADAPRVLAGPPYLMQAVVVGDIIVEKTETGVRGFTLLRTDPPRPDPPAIAPAAPPPPSFQPPGPFPPPQRSPTAPGAPPPPMPHPSPGEEWKPPRE